MRRVERKSVRTPTTLMPKGAGPVELKKARDHQAHPQPKKSFRFAAYKGDDVKRALEALFYGKCAYCETRYNVSAPVDVEHYRPKNAVAEDGDHGGYWWLAMDWDNLLPSCIDCNRRRGQVVVGPSSSLEVLATMSKPMHMNVGKADSFPLAAHGVRATAEIGEFDGEHALLLNPCRDDPSRYLTYNFDPARPLGLVIPTGDENSRTRGATSIQVYGLNRLALVQERTRILRRLEFLGGLVVDLASCIADLENPVIIVSLQDTPAANVANRLRLLRDRTLAEMKELATDDAPYASMTQLWLQAFKERIANEL